MSTSLAYFPGLNGTNALGDLTEESTEKWAERLEEAGKALFQDLPSGFLRTFRKGPKSPVCLLAGRDDMNPHARALSRSLVFPRLVVWWGGKLWVDGSGVEHPALLRAALLSCAGATVFSENSEVVSLRRLVDALMKERVANTADRNNLWRRARARSIMTTTAPLESLIEEAFIALGGSWIVMRKLFGPQEKNNRALRKRIMEAHPAAELDQVAARALQLAWNNLLNFQRQYRFIKTMSESPNSSHPSFAKDLIDYERKPVKLASLERLWPAKHAWRGKSHRVYRYGRLLPDVPMGTFSCAYDPLSFNFGPDDFHHPGIGEEPPSPQDDHDEEDFFDDGRTPPELLCHGFESVGSYKTLEYVKDRTSFVNVALFALHDPDKFQYDDTFGPYATLYAPALCENGKILEGTLPLIPAVRADSSLEGVEILAADRTDNPAVVSLLVETNRFGAVPALCTSWMDQCEKLKTKTTYTASFTFWALDITRVVPKRGSRVDTGLYESMREMALSRIVVYVAGYGTRTRLSSTVMDTIEVRLTKKKSEKTFVVAVPHKLLEERGVEPGDAVSISGYFLVENLVDWATTDYDRTGDETDRIPTVLLPKFDKRSFNALLKRLPDAPLNSVDDAVRDILEDEAHERARRKAYAKASRRERGIPEDLDDFKKNPAAELAAQFEALFAKEGAGPKAHDPMPAKLGPDEALSLAIRTTKARDLIRAALLEGNVASLSYLFMELALGNPLFREPRLSELAVDADLAAATALGRGAEGAFEVVSGFGARNRIISSELYARAAQWFSQHGRSARGTINLAAPLLDAAGRRTLSVTELDLLVRIATHAVVGCHDARGSLLLLRLLDEARSRYQTWCDAAADAKEHMTEREERLLYKLAQTDDTVRLGLLRSTAFDKRAQLTGLYAAACGEAFGDEIWTCTFEERLKAIVARAAQGGMSELFLLGLMLEIEGGFISSGIDEFCQRPGLVDDPTRPAMWELALAAMKLRRWFAEKTHDGRRQRSLTLLLMGDCRWLGKPEEVNNSLNHFDLWRFLGRELRLANIRLIDHARVLKGNGTGRHGFWASLESEATENYWRDHPDISEFPLDENGEGFWKVPTNTLSQALFICQHSTPFIPDIPSVRDVEPTLDNGMLVRYDTIEAPLERGALLINLKPRNIPGHEAGPEAEASDASASSGSSDATDSSATAPEGTDEDHAGNDEEYGSFMGLPPAYPYFGIARNAKAQLLELYTDEEKASACLAVNLMSRSGGKLMELVFLDIFSSFLIDKYKALDECEIRFYMMGILRLDDTEYSPETMPRWRGFTTPSRPCYLEYGGRIRAHERDWTTIAGVKFDRFEIEVEELKDFVDDGLMIFYQPSYLREKDSVVGRTTWFSGFVYGYVDEFDLTTSRNMKLN